MSPIKIAENAYKNGYSAGRKSTIQATVYALSEEEHTTRCKNCRSQLLFNTNHIKHETIYHNGHAEYLDIIICPKCNAEITLPAGII